MNRVVCDMVKSTQGNPKINIYGYLYVKEKSINQRYYWCCEFRKKYNCNGRLTTDLEGEEHVLISIQEHSHAPSASRVDVIKTLNMIKEAASNTCNQPAQIIQDAVINMNQSSYSYMPNKQALGKQISRIRNKDGPSQPQSLSDINVPMELRKTISGEEFLVRDIEFDDDRIMIFCANSNLQYLQDAEYWIMDGTLKTMPEPFSQIYTIHAPVGGESNSRVLPMMYALMTGKSEECYTQLFQELITLGEDTDVILNPHLILIDFEQAAINVVQNEFPKSFHKYCFFHLCQNLWKKIQNLGLVIEYGSNEDFSIKLRYLIALAFLPSSEIPDAFDQIKPLMPPNAHDVVDYFENNYVHGRIRRVLRNISSRSERRNPPQFPPDLWSVYDLIENNYPRTQNLVEGWHQRWLALLGKRHAGVYTIIAEMRKEQHQTHLQAESILRGEPLSYKRKHHVDRENRILTIFNNRNNYVLIDYLREIAHNITF